MKKISTLFAATMLSLSAMATDYTEPLTVVLNGMDIDCDKVQVAVDEESDGSYTFTLNNFQFMGGGVGNIVVKNVKATECGIIKALDADEIITISEGNDPEIKSWLGPSLGEVGIYMNGQIKGDKLNAVLKIDAGSALDILVKLGDKANELGQIPNSGFEDYHTASYKDDTSDEPNAWHSFMSSTGKLASAVSSTKHTFIAEEARPGSEGQRSVQIVSGMALGIVPANGTLTTGRLNAGNISATNTDNNSFTDLSNTDTDGNGDPFYTVLTNTPDSIALWVKFKQGTLADKNKDYKYATVSAILTDGTRYQDPEDKEYTNVAAKAKCATIESNDFTWQRIVVPFDYATYAANNVSPKAIHVTISTNAQPGVGSKDKNDPDQLFVDDMSLIYNSKLKSLKFNGKDIEDFDANKYSYKVEGTGLLNLDDDNLFEAEADGHGAIIYEDYEENEDHSVTATITVLSNDLKDSHVYEVNITNAYLTAVNSTKADNKRHEAVAIYNLNGQNVDTMKAGEIYIVKYADGKTEKVAVK